MRSYLLGPKPAALPQPCLANGSAGEDVLTEELWSGKQRIVIG